MKPGPDTIVIDARLPPFADGEWPEETWVETRLHIAPLIVPEGTTHMQIACDWLRVEPIKVRRLETMTVLEPDDVLRVWLEP